MNQTLVLYPLLAMFALVVMVAVTMFRRRVAFYKTNRVHPQKTATSAEMAAVMPDSRAPDNFRNLFELPMMFYVALLALYITQLVILPQLVLAWVYVAARYAHSFIHCTSNVVMRRFYAFLVSCLTLLAMWILLAYQLFTKA
ncbi:MAG: MAPEG family protein [Betaproteobacteria bacterium]|nr:MAPEG family protein [Betaproteobacteria bacterium]